MTAASTALVTDPEAYLHGLARELARPVVRGWISRMAAALSLTSAALKLFNQGRLPRDPGDVDAAAEHLGQLGAAILHTLNINVRRLEAERTTARGRIARVISPMVNSGASVNRVRAEAHNVNGAAGFPLTEAEVGAVVEAQKYWAGRRRHAA